MYRHHPRRNLSAERGALWTETAQKVIPPRIPPLDSVPPSPLPRVSRSILPLPQNPLLTRGGIVSPVCRSLFFFFNIFIGV